MYKNIHIEIDGVALTLQYLIDAFNSDDDEVITEDDINRILALKAGQSTILENSHAAGGSVKRTTKPNA